MQGGQLGREQMLEGDICVTLMLSSQTELPAQPLFIVPSWSGLILDSKMLPPTPPPILNEEKNAS